MMKKLVAILLLGALLTLSFVGCNEQPNSGVTPNNTDNTTTPEVTTPEVTTPEVTTPEVTTPTPDVTIPEESTPPLDIDPTTPIPEQNLVVELFGDETVEFEAPVFTMNGALSDASPLRFKVENGKINLLGIGNTYTISTANNLSFTYPDDDTLRWGVEKDEKALQAYETIKSSTYFYVLEAEGDVAGYQKIELCIIDGVYYFLTHASNPSKVLRIHHATIG